VPTYPVFPENLAPNKIEERKKSASIDVYKQECGLFFENKK
jgi:hypothetical protein